MYMYVWVSVAVSLRAPPYWTIDHPLDYPVCCWRGYPSQENSSSSTCGKWIWIINWYFICLCGGFCFCWSSVVFKSHAVLPCVMWQLCDTLICCSRLCFFVLYQSWWLFVAPFLNLIMWYSFHWRYTTTGYLTQHMTYWSLSFSLACG